MSGVSSRPRDGRIIATGPRAGERIPVEVDTHVTGVLEHVGGAVSTVTFSFDAVTTTAAPLEVHGESGSLTVPDPNMFDGEVRVRRSRSDEGAVIEPRAGYEQAGRGIGLIDFVAGHGRAGGDVALHVLEIMTALTESAREGRRVDLATTAERPSLAPLTPRTAWRAS